MGCLSYIEVRIEINIVIRIVVVSDLNVAEPCEYIIRIGAAADQVEHISKLGRFAHRCPEKHIVAEALR